MNLLFETGFKGLADSHCLLLNVTSDKQFTQYSFPNPLCTLKMFTAIIQSVPIRTKQITPENAPDNQSEGIWQQCSKADENWHSRYMY